MTYTNCNIDQHGRCQLAENVILSLHEQKCLHKHLFITRHIYEHTAFLRGVLYTEISINRSRHDRVLNRTYIDKQPQTAPAPLPKRLVMAREACPGRILTPITPSTLWTFRSI